VRKKNLKRQPNMITFRKKSVATHLSKEEMKQSPQGDPVSALVKKNCGGPKPTPKCRFLEKQAQRRQV
jgi:hypothetical protein